MTSLILIVLAGLCLWGSIWLFSLVFGAGHKKTEPGDAAEQKKQIVIVIEDEDEDESEVDRQNRVYGDFYGDSYYW